MKKAGILLSLLFASSIAGRSSAQARPSVLGAAGLSWHVESAGDESKVSYHGYYIANNSTTASVWVGAGLGNAYIDYVPAQIKISMDNGQDGETTYCDVNIVDLQTGALYFGTPVYAGPNGGFTSLSVPARPASTTVDIGAVNAECLLPGHAAAPPHAIYGAYWQF